MARALTLGSFVASVAATTLNLHLLPKSYGTALCNDGTMSGYYFKAGTNNVWSALTSSPASSRGPRCAGTARRDRRVLTQNRARAPPAPGPLQSFTRRAATGAMTRRRARRARRTCARPPSGRRRRTSAGCSSRRTRASRARTRSTSRTARATATRVTRPPRRPRASTSGARTSCAPYLTTLCAPMASARPRARRSCTRGAPRARVACCSTPPRWARGYPPQLGRTSRATPRCSTRRSGWTLRRSRRVLNPLRPRHGTCSRSRTRRARSTPRARPCTAVPTAGSACVRRRSGGRAAAWLRRSQRRIAHV